VTSSFRPLLRRRRHAALAIVWLALAALWPGAVAIGQDEGAATVKDIIWARKVLMAAVGDRSDQIRTMISERDIDLERARAQARHIAVLLTVFPHLFPSSSNQWKENANQDPASDTIASPDIWDDFQDFYNQAMGNAKIARDMSHAGDVEELKSLHRALEITCDVCHSLYLKE
jgi:cytochrome c556